MMLFAYSFTPKIVFKSFIHFGPYISDDNLAIMPPKTSISLRSSLSVSLIVCIVVSFPED